MFLGIDLESIWSILLYEINYEENDVVTLLHVLARKIMTL